MGNPDITVKRGEFDAPRSTIEGIQRKASDEKRDLTEDELRSIKDQGDQARKIADEVTMLAEIDTRSAAVAQLGAQVDETATRSVSNTTAVDRDPGHYRSETEGGTRSFFADLMRAKEDDGDARDRLTEHHPRTQLVQRWYRHPASQVAERRVRRDRAPDASGCGRCPSHPAG